ncbi:MAG: response regulator, partial [Sulfurovum sp.]|nr:response regulator [Sulfurovaceae bacterium]
SKVIDENLNILVIDDSPIILRFIEIILKNYNTNVITVYTAIDGIEKFKSKKIDIIFIDEFLLDSLGHKAIKTIRQIEITHHLHSIPIFAITSDTNKDTKNILLESGANIVMYKPLESQYIIETIRNFRVLKEK